MAFDAFMKISGIDGESTDDKHSAWIEILSFSHGISQPATILAGSTQGVERSVHEDFTVVKTLDKATPKLNVKCCNGEHVGEIKMELTRATGDKQRYMEYVLTDCIISSVRPQGNTQGDETVPLEEVSFNYGKIQWTYAETDQKSGEVLGDVSATWDLLSNTGR